MSCAVARLTPPPAPLAEGWRELLRHRPNGIFVVGDRLLPEGRVTDAVRALAAADVVFGARGDGGWDLVAMRRPHDLFSGVAFGTSVALAQATARGRSLGLRVAVLEPLDAGPAALRPVARRLHLEVTNRCPSQCATCHRTFAPSPPRDLSPEDVDRILAATPEVRSAALQVNGEPLVAPRLGEILDCLERRGVAAELNTAGLLLDGQIAAMLSAGPLAALNVSLDAATPETYRALRGADAFATVEGNVRRFLARRRGGPRVSLWMVATRRNLHELPDLVRLAARLGADEVFLQRLVIHGRGLGADRWSLHGRLGERERSILDEAERLARELGVALGASGGGTLAAMLEPPTPRPRPICRRPWESAAVLAGGEIVPCCISTFLTGEDVTMGNALTEGWDAVYHGPRYEKFRLDLIDDAPDSPCRHCGVRWSV